MIIMPKARPMPEFRRLNSQRPGFWTSFSISAAHPQPNARGVATALVAGIPLCRAALSCLSPYLHRRPPNTVSVPISRPPCALSVTPVESLELNVGRSTFPIGIPNIVPVPKSGCPGAASPPDRRLDRSSGSKVQPPGPNVVSVPDLHRRSPIPCLSPYHAHHAPFRSPY